MGSSPVPLGRSGWTLWPDALLRGTGFPADGLGVFAAPDAAAAVDAALGQGLDDAAAAEATGPSLDAAQAAFADAADEIAADPRFLEAVTWQNPDVADRMVALTSSRGTNSKSRTRRRERERVLARYWQRYCGKNDTIGFFGPVCWVRIDPDQDDAVRVVHGPAFVRDRRVELEFWALERFVEALTYDPAVGPSLPVTRQPHLAGGTGLVGAADGRPAGDLLAATGASVDELRAAVDDGLLRWGPELPYHSGATEALRTALAGGPGAAAFDRLLAARDAVAAAPDDPAQLKAAFTSLDQTFTELTGAAAEHRAGQMYAGRRVCFEDTTRDVDVSFGAPVLEALVGPLSVLLPAARWLSVVADRCCHDAYDAVFGTLGDGTPLVEYWAAVQDRLAAPDSPITQAAEQFSARWRELFALEDVGAEAVVRSSSELAEDVVRLFPADAPAWPGARVHSPDVQLCASDVDALNRGEFDLVLGELHAVWPSLDDCLFLDRHPDVATLREAADRDYGPMVRPLFTVDFPRYTARLAPTLGYRDPQVAYAPAPGADPARVLPGESYEMHRVDGEVRAVRRAGCPGALESVSADDLFTVFTGFYTASAFKLGVGGAHSPRITLDRLVVEREAWRTTAGDARWVERTGRARYTGMRRWRAELGLPERAFVTIGTEVKPVYVDFTSPVLAGSLASMLADAVRRGGPEVDVTITELLPTPEQAWLPDGAGRRYLSELRMQAIDPRPAVRPPLPV